MKKVEGFLITVLLIGALANYFLIAGAKWALIIGIGLLANIYLFDFEAVINDLPLSKYSDKERKNRVLGQKKMLPGYAITSLLIGALFCFKTWPGGSLIISIGFFVALFAIYTLWQNQQNNRSFALAGIKRIAVAVIVGVVFFSLPYYFWLEQTYRRFPDYIEARKAFDQDPENETLKTRMDEAYAKTEMKNAF